MNINYDALKTGQSTQTMQAIDGLTAKPLGAKSAIRSAYAKLFLYLSGACLLFAILPGVLKGAIVLVVAICGFYYFKKQSTQRRQMIQAFMHDNGWQEDPAFLPTVPSMIPAGATAKTRGAVLSGEFAGLPFWLYQLQTTYRRNGGESTPIQSIVVTLELPKDLPDIVIDAIADNAFGSTLINSPSARGMRPIQLEGGFQTYFNVWMKPGEQIDVLSLITPELMQKLIDEGCLLNIDIHKNLVHIISTVAPFVVYGYTQNQLDFAQMLAASLSHKLKNFNASAR